MKNKGQGRWILLLIVALFAAAAAVWLMCPPAKAGDGPYPMTRPEHAKRTAGTWYLGGGPVYQDDLGLSVLAGYRFDNRVMILFGPSYVHAGQGPQRVSISHQLAEYGCRRTTTWNVTMPGQTRDEWGAQFLVMIPLGR